MNLYSLFIIIQNKFYLFSRNLLGYLYNPYLLDAVSFTPGVHHVDFYYSYTFLHAP
jgi:hypothetical protein